jgi:hypothetical protein
MPKKKSAAKTREIEAPRRSPPAVGNGSLDRVVGILDAGAGQRRPGGEQSHGCGLLAEGKRGSTLETWCAREAGVNAGEKSRRCN